VFLKVFLLIIIIIITLPFPLTILIITILWDVHQLILILFLI